MIVRIGRRVVAARGRRRVVGARMVWYIFVCCVCMQVKFVCFVCLGK